MKGDAINAAREESQYTFPIQRKRTMSECTYSRFNVCWRLIVWTREHRNDAQNNTFNL